MPFHRWPSALALGLALAAQLVTSSADAHELPVSPTRSPLLYGGIWAGAQLVPSPLLITGDRHVGAGLRWQVTPLLISFGVQKRPLRLFFVPPIARHSGSLELHASPEWACCAPDDGTSWLLRTGVRAYLPLMKHGEALSLSLGGSYHFADRRGFAGDVGVYTLQGVLGLNVTVSPALRWREVVTALSIRFF